VGLQATSKLIDYARPPDGSKSLFSKAEGGKAVRLPVGQGHKHGKVKPFWCKQLCLCD
jgi:hypothetical protein